jgi:hypothetical protein
VSPFGCVLFDDFLVGSLSSSTTLYSSKLFRLGHARDSSSEKAREKMRAWNAVCFRYEGLYYPSARDRLDHPPDVVSSPGCFWVGGGGGAMGRARRINHNGMHELWRRARATSRTKMVPAPHPPRVCVPKKVPPDRNLFWSCAYAPEKRSRSI